MGWPEVIIALLSAGGGAGILKVADTWLTRVKIKSDSAKHIRDEKTAEIASLKEEVKYYKSEANRAEAESDKYKREAFDILMQYKMFRLEISQILIDNGLNPRDILKGDYGTST
jgi:hypothetical protein